MTTRSTPAGSKRHARIARGRDDAAPVGIAAGDGRFDQGTVGDRLGDAAGIVARLAAPNVDRDQVRGPFAVVGNLPGQLDAQVVEGRLERRKIAAGQW